MKLATVIGARPQYIKAAPVSRALAAVRVDEVLIDTGQHYDDSLSRVFIEELGMARPAYSLGVSGGSHADMTSRMMREIERALLEEKPAAVLVYGDTNSTLAGALTAAKMAIPVAHVEAGLRSFRHGMPEEINRRIVDHLAGLLFCPTALAAENLEREGIGTPSDRMGRQVHVVGDVMVDALRLFGAQRSQHPLIAGLGEGRYALVTAHRAETTADRGILENLVIQLLALSEGMPVVLPLHPRTRKVLIEQGLLGALQAGSQLHVIEPLGYLDFTAALHGARIVITDSGGVQKEAAILGVPCLTLRDETEWVETVDSGWNRLIGSRPQNLVEQARAALRLDCGPLTVYGSGNAASEIAATVKSWMTASLSTGQI